MVLKFFKNDLLTNALKALFNQTLILLPLTYTSMTYEARVRFRIRVWVWVQDSAIFEKVGCGCGD